MLCDFQCLALVSGRGFRRAKHAATGLIGDHDNLEDGRRRLASSSVAPARNADNEALLQVAADQATGATGATVGVVDDHNQP